MKGFEWRLENLREKHGYENKNEVSRLLGFSDNTYGHYENGDRSPDHKTLIKISDLFQVSVNYLLRGEETTEHQNWDNLITVFKERGIEQPSVMNIKELSTLDEEQLKKLNNYCETLVQQAHKKK